jgi:hypothetical protein
VTLFPEIYVKKNKTVFGIMLSFSLFLMGEFASAASYFSGCAGINSILTADPENTALKPLASFNQYFAGQFDLSAILLRTEFSIATDNILQKSIFRETDAVFKIDEVSATIRHQTGGNSTYYSLFMGTYEPIGSDIFLQRQFGIEPISSIITDNWQGLNGSVVYPFYGIGGSIITHLYQKPWAAGVYLYVNQDNDENEYMLNTNLRFACVYDYFTADIAGGIGAPLGTQTADEEDVFLVIDKLYANMGANILIGSRYTTALFLQGGFSDVLLTKGTSSIKFDNDNTYILAELRMTSLATRVDCSFFSLPQETVDSMLLIDDTLGINMAIYANHVHIGSSLFTLGSHLTLSVPEKSYEDIPARNFFSDAKDTANFTVAPFMAVTLGTGTLHSMVKINITDLISSPKNAVEIAVGYKARLN